MKVILVTAILGLLGTTGFFWHSMRDVYATSSSVAVDTQYSRIMQAQKIETMLRERSIDAVIALLQNQRDLAVVRLGEMRHHIDAATWRMGRSQYTIEKLDTAIEKEIEYRRVNGETSGRLSDRAGSVLEANDE